MRKVGKSETVDQLRGRVALTGEVTTLTRSAATTCQAPRISPDGRWLAVSNLERPFEYVVLSDWR